jgi:hypothetical protein
MKRVIFYIVLLILVGVGFFFGRDYLPQITSAQGALRIQSSPKATVFISGETKGQTPVSERLKPGTYEIRLDPQDTTTTAPWLQQIPINKGVETFVTVTLGPTENASTWQIVTLEKAKVTTELAISSEKDGSEIFINGERKGTTPLSFQNELPIGIHEIRLASEGVSDTLIKLKLPKGYKVQLSAHPAGLATTPTQESTESATPSTTKTEDAQVMVKILDTPTGWLRVRSEASKNGTELAKVNPGETYALTDTDGDWFKIEYEKDKEGWISSEYAKKVE